MGKINKGSNESGREKSRPFRESEEGRRDRGAGFGRDQSRKPSNSEDPNRTQSTGPRSKRDSE